MANEMRQRGIQEPDINRSVGAMKYEPGAQVQFGGETPPSGGMSTFEIQLPNGNTYEVQAPDIKAATQQAQQYRVQTEHPWMQTNNAIRAGQRPELGKEFPGSGYIPTKTQAAGDIATLGAMLAAGPAAGAAAPAYPVLAPALARIGVGGASRGIEAGLQGQPMGKAALQGGGIQALLEGAGPLAGVLKRAGPAVAARAMAASPGSKALAYQANTKALENLLAAKQAPTAAVPGEGMGMYVPTGVPAGHGGPNLLGPTGQPLKPAIPPKIVPYGPELPGWTMKDTLKQKPPVPAPSTAPSTDWGSLLKILLGTAANSQSSPEPETRL
jgi:hypothetical protein